jgi:hypothetical protein
MLPIDDPGPITQANPRASQVDTGKIEDNTKMQDFKPRTLAQEVAEGGYAQEGDQSYPASGPRVTAGMRGDMNNTPQRGMRLDTDNDGE